MPVTSASSAERAAAAAPGLRLGVSFTPDLISLRAVFGQDEVNHDTTRYPVDEQHLVRVPIEAVGPLIATGGFISVEKSVTAISVGTVEVRHDDAEMCSYGGRQYIGDENGNILVPAEAACDLLAHGFVPVLPGVTSGSAAPSLCSRSKKS